MVQRKSGLSAAQERLARLSGLARPTSQQQRASLPLPLIAMADIPEKPATESFEHESVTTYVTSNVTLDVSSHVAYDDTLSVTQHDETHVTRYVTDDVTAHDTQHVTSHVASNAIPVVTEQLSERVRGRWTHGQKQFLVTLAKQKRTTAGELIRHIVAWYLVHGQANMPPANQSAELAFGIPLPREKGLKLMDFLTTPAQVKAIRQAARVAGLGEAAFLRLAVDVYREHGPLVQVAE